MNEHDPTRRRRLALRVLPTALLMLVAGGVADGAAGAETPPYFQRLVEQGNVQFEFYDPRTVRPQHAGLAVFHLHTEHRYRYQYTALPDGLALRVTVVPQFTSVTTRADHLLLLPKQLNHDRRWGDRLVRHEFDHVAVSTDPRVAMLIDRLLRNMGPIELVLPAGRPVDPAKLDEAIVAEATRRREAVDALVQYNYTLMDRVSRHGTVPIADRERFFKTLYTGPNLDRAGFPFAGEVGTLLRQRKYRDARLLYEF